MFNQIRQYISNGNTEKALDKTMHVFKHHKIPYNDVIVLMNQFKSMTKDCLHGLISHSCLYKNMSRINSAILNLLDLNKVELKKKSIILE